MLKKALKAGAFAAAVALPGFAFAQDAPTPAPAAEEASPHTFTANVGLFSQYIFRGLSQTNGRPAIQGGFDYAYNFGPAAVYIGSWNSNISGLTVGGQYTSSSIESDLYAGIKGNFGKTDFTWDVGFLQYFYPGNVNTLANGAKGDTSEVYGALGWKWLTFKASYVVSNKAFAVLDAKGTYYLDLSAAYPIGETGITLLAHYGRQKYDGTDYRTAALGSNDSIYTYNDYKLGVTYDLGKLSKVLNAVTVGAYSTHPSRSSGLVYNCSCDSQAGAYPNSISDRTGVGFLQRTF